jgi:hypothetical protein
MSYLFIYKQVGPDIKGEAPFDLFGWSLAMSADGTIIAAGALLNDANGTKSGHACVFEKDPFKQLYNQIGYDLRGETRGDQFGYSLAMSADGTTVVVSAIKNHGNGADSGHARVYQKDSSTQTYQQFGPDINGQAEFDRFGSSLALSADGTILAVGAVRNNGSGTSSGQVHIYQKDSANQLYRQIGPAIQGKAPGDLFGWTLTMSTDGAMVAAGAIHNNLNST